MFMLVKTRLKSTLFETIDVLQKIRTITVKFVLKLLENFNTSNCIKIT